MEILRSIDTGADPGIFGGGGLPGRHLKHELGGVEFKLSDKFKPGKQFKNLSDIVALKCNSFEKYNYNFELEKSVLDDFQIHEMNKIAISN